MNDISKFFDISPRLLEMVERCEEKCRPVFARLDEIAAHNEAKVLSAFGRRRISAAHLTGTTGYGYDDLGRDTLDKVFADALDAEDALVRHNFVSGTHTLTVALFGLLRPGDTMVAVTGAPYDTLEEVIGIRESKCSLKEYGVSYDEVELLPDGSFDFEGIRAKIKPN
ncbi:MAG: methionine gamma-lyase family protein, partial [Oscillospiraceae bacterium]|nr:methionine gamma-lyase family protein [Oscillospiraceae bacterium]